MDKGDNSGRDAIAKSLVKGNPSMGWIAAHKNTPGSRKRIERPRTSTPREVRETVPGNRPESVRGSNHSEPGSESTKGAEVGRTTIKSFSPLLFARVVWIRILESPRRVGTLSMKKTGKRPHFEMWSSFHHKDGESPLDFSRLSVANNSARSIQGPLS